MRVLVVSKMDSSESVSRTETDFADCISNDDFESEAAQRDPTRNDSLVPFEHLTSDSEKHDTSDNRDGVSDVSLSSDNNIVATWADEFYRMRETKFPGENFKHQDLVANSVDPPLSQGAFQSFKQTPIQQHQPTQDEFLPTTVDHYHAEAEKPFKCHFCQTSYGTPGRLKRHFSTKKHKAATEKAAKNIEIAQKTTSLKATQPIATPPNQNFDERGKIPDMPTLSEHLYQPLSPIKLPQMQMPQFKPYSEYSSPSVETYPSDWPIFPNHIDYLRNSSQTQEPHHAQNSLFFQHHLNPMRYGKIPFTSLHTSSHQSPQFPETPDQPRSYPHPSFYQPQTPPTPSWYYPITPYPSPNPYLQRYSDYSTVQETYQKFETNNNYYPNDTDPKPFDQRPLQQEAMNLWTPKITNPELDVSVEEVDTISNDDSETMSPAVSPDSQHEPVSSSDCPPNLEVPSQDPEEKWRCEQCDRDFSKASFLSQHYDAVHPMTCPFRCEVCHENYPSLTLLAKHPCAGDEKPFKCDVCDKGFKSKVELTRHKHLHSTSGAKNFSCHLCPKSCARKDQLLRHIRVHESHSEDLTKQYSG